MGLTTLFWSLSQKPKIGHLRDDAKCDFSDFWPSLTSGQTVGKMDTQQKLPNVPLYIKQWIARIADLHRSKSCGTLGIVWGCSFCRRLGLGS